MCLKKGYFERKKEKIAFLKINIMEQFGGKKLTRFCLGLRKQVETKDMFPYSMS